MRLALEESVDGGDRLDLELRRDELVLIDVDLDQLHGPVCIFGRDLVEDRAELLAGAAPLRPEIQQHEVGHRRFDDVALQALDGFAFDFAHAKGRHASKTPAVVWRPIWSAVPLATSRERTITRA